MKKYLILFCLLGLVQASFGFTEKEFTAPQDTIIVEFGKTGKIFLVVDNKEDFERLKGMNVNQIIQELNLQVDEKTGESVIVTVDGVKGSKEVVKVYEDGPVTEVNVAGIRILVDESNPDTKVRVQTGTRKKQDPPFRTYFNLDLGLNNYLDQNGQFPKTSQPYAVRGWGSWNVGLNFMASQRISKGFNWDFGLGFQWYNFKFENRDFQAVRGEDGIEFVQRNDVAGFKSKISASYLTAMSLFRLDFGKMNDAGRKGMRVALGPYAGYRLGGTSKYVYRPLEGGSRRKEHTNTGIFLNNFRYGLRGEVGFGRFNLYATYDFNQLFQDGKGPELNPIAFGIVF